MAYPALGTTEWNELSSAYLRKSIAREPRDQYTKKHPMLVWLRSRQKTEDTAAKWTWPIEDGSAAVGRSYIGTQGHTLTDVKVATTAEQDCAFFAEPIFIAHTDGERTKGTGKVFDLLEAKKKHAFKRVTEKHSAYVWATSRGSSTDPMSIPLAIPIDPTADVTFNNISGAAGKLTTWRNKTQTSTGSWSTNGIDKLDALLNDIAEEAGDPDILVTTKAIFGFMQKAGRGYLANNASVSTKAGRQMADLGIPVLYHNGIPIVHDSDAVSGRIYAINADAIQWVANKEGDYTLMGDGFENTMITGVMGSLAMIRLEGNLCCYERRALGQVDGITAA